VLLLLTLGLLLVQGWIAARPGTATIGGKGGMRRPTPLGWARWPLFALVALIVIATVILPYTVIVGTAFLAKFYLWFTPSNLTLANFDYVLFQSNGLLAIRNSLVTGAVAACAAVVLGVVAAYLVVRRLVPFRRLLSFLVTAPIVIPGMVMAIAAYALYSSGPVALYGTIWILVVVYIAKFLPFAYTAATTALVNVHDDLEGAARVLGATRLRVLRDITAPLIRSGVLSAWILVFVPAVKELSASILLYNSHTTVIATAIMDAYSVPSWESVAALSTILLFLNAVVIGAGMRFFGGSVLGRSN
jgi:iron(III) transport system permease protein